MCIRDRPLAVQLCVCFVLSLSSTFQSLQVCVCFCLLYTSKMAFAAGAPVVPVVIDGSYKIMEANHNLMCPEMCIRDRDGRPQRRHQGAYLLHQMRRGFGKPYCGA